eukprot:122979_1
MDDLRRRSSMATWDVKFCNPTRLSVRAVLDKRFKADRIELGLSLSGTSNATLILATDTPGPSTLRPSFRMLVVLPKLTPSLLNKFVLTAAKRRNPAKKKRVPNDGPVLTTTPEGRA